MCVRFFCAPFTGYHTTKKKGGLEFLPLLFIVRLRGFSLSFRFSFSIATRRARRRSRVLIFCDTCASIVVARLVIRATLLCVAPVRSTCGGEKKLVRRGERKESPSSRARVTLNSLPRIFLGNSTPRPPSMRGGTCPLLPLKMQGES